MTVRLTGAVVAVCSLVTLGAPAMAEQLQDRERFYERLTRHRARLEQQLSEQSRRIRRLKSQPAGMGRDYQLKSALRTSQKLAERLTKLQQRIHQAHSQLVAAYERAIRAASSAKQRDPLQKKRARLLRSRRASNTRIVTSDRASPYDSPEDLEEKADLLKDSEEKVRRQLRRLQRRLALLSQRARLQRHARAADDNPFIENAPRRTSRVTTSRRQTSEDAGASKTTTVAPQAAADQKTAVADADGERHAPSAEPQPPQAPAPGEADDGYDTADTSMSGAAQPEPTGGGSWSGGDAAPAPAPGAAANSGGDVSVSVTIRDVIDPSLLRKLDEVGQGGNVGSRLAALKRAAAKLDRLASQLSSKARTLRQRASQLRKKK